MPAYPSIPDGLGKIKKFVVLMLENRSFDHLLGFQHLHYPEINGFDGNEFNYQVPGDPTSAPFGARRAQAYAMPFDPPHEFSDIRMQLFAPEVPAGGGVTLGGFVLSANAAARNFDLAAKVMEGFQPDQLPALDALVREFAVFNHWHASLPGPTWPNRFFIHAATSGGLTDSPSTEQIMAGYSFAGGTIYQRLADARFQWRIYHDGLPQTVGIDDLRSVYLDPFAKNFRQFPDFAVDVNNGDLPEYTFIEPRYDTGNNYVGGNSMHPLNDIRKGEKLLKDVYEALRGSALWDSVMLVVTFDEHGGFYDHVVPPAAVPTGDDTKYADRPPAFDFTRLGVRVPALVISAYTQRGTVIGTVAGDPATTFDHTSVLKTVENRFGLKPLTTRDAAAASLAVALNLADPRTDAPTVLPGPVSDVQSVQLVTTAAVTQSLPDHPLSDNQQSLVDLALLCHLDLADPGQKEALRAEHAAVTSQAAAAVYLAKFEATLKDHRENPDSSP